MESPVEEKIDYPWVTFMLGSESYCISTRLVSSMTILQEILPAQGSEGYVKGLMTLNGNVLMVVDLRTLFQMPTLEDDYEGLKGMKAQHLAWVEELERCVESGQAFTLATNPHQCALGKWYYAYKTESNQMKALLDQLREPHETLHGCAIAVQTRLAGGDVQGARKVLEQARDLCNRVICPLLDRIVALYPSVSQGMIIVLQEGERMFGLQVDSISAIEYFTESMRRPLARVGEETGSAYIQGLFLTDEGKCYLELNDQAVLDLCQPMEQAAV